MIEHVSGAIGYADADQANSANTASLKFNGVLPRRNTIRNGMYDFFTNEWLFKNTAGVPATSNAGKLITKLYNYSKDPANLTTAKIGTKASYWATEQEMSFNKISDTTYPAKRDPGAFKQTP